MLIWDIVHQCVTSRLQCALVQSRSKTLAKTHAAHEREHRLFLEINKT